MPFKRFAAAELVAVVMLTLCSSSIVGAASVRSITVFAEGAAVNATAPDSIALTNDSVWVSYANGADSTGLSGSSTIVRYTFSGQVRHMFSIKGSVDGLKVDPRTGLVWALQNQDGNSTLTLIDPEHGIVEDSPFEYAVKSSTRGYDDVVFRGDATFLSYTNPSDARDATIQRLVNGSNPLRVKSILTMGATGTNLATGAANQPTTQNDPDSLKLTPFGDLLLSSGDDGQLVFVANPDTDMQSVSFLTLLDPSSGLHVSGLDDTAFATAPRGTFYLTETGKNRVLAIQADDLEFGSLFASVGSVHALVSVDLRTGNLSTFVGSLSGPHGLAFLPASQDDEEDRR